MTPRTLRDYQTRSIDALRQALKAGYRRPLLQLPTGGGKTVIACAIIQSALDRGKRVIFTVPAITLIDQTVADFTGQGVTDIGVIQADHPMTNPHRRLQIASVQTLRRRAVPATDLWIIDEAHRLDKGITDLMGQDQWAGVPFIGLSATPWTKGLGRLYDTLIVAATTADLIERGSLCKFRVFAPSHPDLTGVKTTAGDYQQDQLSDAMQKGSLVGDVVSTWLRLGEGRPTLCFAVDCAHAQALQARFQDAGVKCGYQDASTSDLDRRAIRRAFHNGDLQVVCNVGTLTTGVDWDVRCIILARPTKSEMLYCQMVGRGLRPKKGDPADCLILDHSDTTLRLGFVTDIHHADLDDGRMSVDKEGEAEKREPRLPKACPSCSYLVPAGVYKCPSCGFQGKKQSSVEHVDGKIVELDTARKAKRNRDMDWPEKVSFIAQLRCYAGQKGYAQGWVANKYREWTGVWPNDPRVAHTPASRRVEPWVYAWIKSRQIAYAKAKDKRSHAVAG